MSNHSKRFIVKDGQSAITRVREPWQVIDTETNTIVDEYKSKRAATMDANYRNQESN